jgi:tripartite-type tricarboxylate transporter receptor subunit TctC
MDGMCKVIARNGGVGFIFVAVGWICSAPAQNYPARPVRIVVPYAAGGLPDTMTRITTPRLVATMGQPFVVDNRPGAGGINACEIVAGSPPDGYTLLIADVGQTAINPALYSKLSYDPIRDFAPVSIIGISAQFLVTHSAVPANTLPELIALAKMKPGQLSYGSGGTGSLHHLSMEALKAPLGLEITHVPYKGTAQAVPGLLNGEVMLVFSALPSIAGHIKAGRVKLLAVNTLKRSAQAPEVPTVAEVTGIKDYDYPPEIGVLAPARTSAAIVKRLAEEIGNAVRHSETASRFATLGIEGVGNTPDEYMRQIRIDIAKYAKAVKASGIKLD